MQRRLAEGHGLAVTDSFLLSDCPAAQSDAHGKELLSQPGSGLLAGSGKGPVDVAKELADDEICEAFGIFFGRLQDVLDGSS